MTLKNDYVIWVHIDSNDAMSIVFSVYSIENLNHDNNITLINALKNIRKQSA